MLDIVQRMRYGWPWFLLAGLMLAVYWPSFWAQYINYDDPGHFLNGLFSKPGSIFLTGNSVYKTYVPLSIISAYIENIFFKTNPHATHIINFLMHGCVVFLIFHLACRLGVKKPAAYIAALIFAVHPMHVESVAWATERKGLLYANFYLMALLFYCDYADTKAARAYVFALACALLSVLSKPMALSLPLVLFLIDYMRGRGLSLAGVMDKVPFFLVVEPVVLITYLQNSRHLDMVWPGALMLWAWCGAFYINTFFWPAHLLPLYGPPVMEGFSLVVQIFLPVAGIAGAWLVLREATRKWIVFALFFYFLSTFFLWRFDIVQDLNFVADRFMYLPSFGFCLLVGVVVHEWFLSLQVVRQKILFWMVILVILTSMIYKSCQQVRVWDNGVRFFSCILEERPGMFFALVGRIRAVLGVDPVFERGGDDDIRQSVDPRYWRAVARRQGGEVEIQRKTSYLRQLWALRDLRVLARNYAGSASYNCYSAVVHENWCRNNNAACGKSLDAYSRAIGVAGNNAQLFFSRGRLALKMNRNKAALRDALTAIKLSPGTAAYHELAVLSALHGRDVVLAKHLFARFQRQR